MRNLRPHRLTAAAAEELLDGRGPDSPLAGLVATAAAPGLAEETAGEAVACAAFVAARAGAPVPVRPPIGRRAFASRLIAAKAVALVVLAAGATGGVALAANNSLTRPSIAHRPAAAAPTPAVPQAAAPLIAVPPTTLPSTARATTAVATTAGTRVGEGPPKRRPTPTTARARTAPSAAAPQNPADAAGPAGTTTGGACGSDNICVPGTTNPGGPSSAAGSADTGAASTGGTPDPQAYKASIAAAPTASAPTAAPSPTTGHGTSRGAQAGSAPPGAMNGPN